MSTDTVTVTINGFNDAAEPTRLWCHYSGQTTAQEVYVELDTRDGELTMDYNGEVGNAVPEAVWHGQVLRFNLPIIPTAEGANWLLKEVAPMAQAILDALAAEAASPADPWSDPAGSRYETAKEKLALWLASADELPDCYIVAEVSSDEVDMLAGGYAVAADATDAEIEVLAAEILSDYASNSGFGAAVCDGLVYHLEQARDKAAAEACERIADIVSDLYSRDAIEGYHPEGDGTMRCDLINGTRVYVGANDGGFTWAQWESDGGEWYVTAEGLRADVAELASFIESL